MTATGMTTTRKATLAGRVSPPASPRESELLDAVQREQGADAGPCAPRDDDGHDHEQAAAVAVREDVLEHGEEACGLAALIAILVDDGAIGRRARLAKREQQDGEAREHHHCSEHVGQFDALVDDEEAQQVPRR